MFIRLYRLNWCLINRSKLMVGKLKMSACPKFCLLPIIAKPVKQLCSFTIIEQFVVA